VALAHGKLAPDLFNYRAFDVIFSNNVIEHIPKPIEFLRTLRTVLAPNGRVWVSCPNAASYEARILQSYWPQYAPVDHVRLYSPQALRNALEHAGLTVDRVWTDEGSFDFPLTMLAGARNFLVRRAGGKTLLSHEYGGGATIPSAGALRKLMKFSYRAVPILGIPFAFAAPRLGVAQHLRALARSSLPA
jgi:SAM-dependent methyltransferase